MCPVATQSIPLSSLSLLIAETIYWIYCVFIVKGLLGVMQAKINQPDNFKITEAKDLFQR